MCLSPHKDTAIVTVLIIGIIIITRTTSHFLAWNHSTIGEALSPDPIGVLSANWTATLDYKVITSNSQERMYMYSANYIPKNSCKDNNKFT